MFKPILFVPVLVGLTFALVACASPTPTPAPTSIPPTATPVPPTATATRVPPTNTAVPATATVAPPTNPPVPPTAIKPSVVAPTFIEGIYFFTEPNNIAVLRFFKDGMVLNGGGNHLNMQTAWSTLSKTMTPENANKTWHGTYTLTGDQIKFAVAPPGSNVGVNNWAGTVQSDKLILQIGNDPRKMTFVRYTTP